jgi:8-oxo-dGTP pyrophosphatase MutT (NUDIX family)
MRIFLNDRIIEFVSSAPENPLASTLVIEYTTGDSLHNAWNDFVRYDKYVKLSVVDPEYLAGVTSAAFQSFASFFKFVPAAGGLVRNEHGAYLFIHRLGFWDLPKGKVDHADIPGPGNTRNDMATAEVAAIREVMEETGLKTVRITKQLAATWHIYFAKEKFYLKKTQWFEMEANSVQKLKPATNEGIFLVKWTPPENIHCILAHTYASLREFLLEVIL